MNLWAVCCACACVEPCSEMDANSVFTDNPDYNPASNTYDIRTSVYPSTLLSNFAPNAFVFDGVACASLEGFLQSLKVQDCERQSEICAMVGGRAMRAGRRHDWKTAQTLYWRGKPYPRLSPGYQQLLRSAFRACYNQNPDYRAALAVTADMKLDHSIGKNDPLQTVLTIAEFTGILTWLRDEGV